MEVCVLHISLENSTLSLNNAKAYTAPLNNTGLAILVSHSQSGPYMWGLGGHRQNLVTAAVALELEGHPFYQ